MYNQAQELEKLKTIKRRARYQYHACKALYENKLRTAEHEDRKIYREAISVLDGMYRMYEQLKFKMRKRSYEKQIVFAEKWNKYISCIDTLTAHRTNDKYLLRYVVGQDTVYAKQTAIKLWKDYTYLSNNRFKIN